ncbi:MAG: sigma-70 family RNA polymerase sigma factor [Sandaracinaceae bacterium]|nr:sigma-70 family RNA polymerase sigma factor [Sandaracinaceae bacterium]
MHEHVLSSALRAVLTDASSVEEERQLVLRATDGDALAFRAIVERHHRALYHLAFRMVGDGADAEDLVQESFAKAYLHLDRYDSGYRLSTWLHRIALNTCRDHLKSARRRERPSGEELDERANGEAGQDEDLDQRRRAAQVQAALGGLKESYREVLVLKDLQGFSYDEIKDITGCPITSLKIRVLRARARLRELLGEQEP